MALQKTKVLNITSVTGIATVGIFTAGVTATDAGTASTTYVRSVVMHNTGLGTARVSLYVNPADAISVEVSQPDVGGAGIGSAVNFLVNGDVEV